MEDGTVILECTFEDWATGSTTDWPKLKLPNDAWPTFFLFNGCKAIPVWPKKDAPAIQLKQEQVEEPDVMDITRKMFR
jgi:hypothetical protein